MPELSREDVISYLEKASLMEISELVKDIEEKFGIEAAAPVAVAAAPAPAAGDATPAAEKTEFNIVLDIEALYGYFLSNIFFDDSVFKIDTNLFFVLKPTSK